MSLSVPEVPNFFVLLNRLTQESEWAHLLERWDSVIFASIAALFLALLFRMGIKNAALIPNGLQNFLEWMTSTIRTAAKEILGDSADRYIPFLGTIFLYILVLNWLVLIPFFKAPSSSLNVTIALALCVFFYVQYLNIKNYGLFGFIYHMAGEPKDLIGWILSPMLLCIELLTQLTRPLTLALRLFGNIFGEDILIGTFSLFGVALLASYGAPIGFPFQVPFLFLAIFTGLLQALVFTYLSAIYILLSMPREDH